MNEIVLRSPLTLMSVLPCMYMCTTSVEVTFQNTTSVTYDNSSRITMIMSSVGVIIHTVIGHKPLLSCAMIYIISTAIIDSVSYGCM